MKHKYSDTQLENTIKISHSWAEVCRYLGCTPATGSQTNLSRRARSLHFDYSHFTGQAWSRGKKFPSKFPLEDYVSNHRKIGSSSLRIRLLKERLKEEKCEICELDKWNNEPIPLELDHKDSNHWNNNLENLQIICPNCHAIETKKRKCWDGGTGIHKGPRNPRSKSLHASSSLALSTKFCKCGKSISKKALTCKSCAISSRGTKIKWPSKETLLEIVHTSNYSQAAKSLGVSDNAIRKHLRTH